jgi:hypothetical protein
MGVAMVLLIRLQVRRLVQVTTGRQVVRKGFEVDEVGLVVRNGIGPGQRFVGQRNVGRRKTIRLSGG